MSLTVQHSGTAGCGTPCGGPFETSRLTPRAERQESTLRGTRTGTGHAQCVRGRERKTSSHPTWPLTAPRGEGAGLGHVTGAQASGSTQRGQRFSAVCVFLCVKTAHFPKTRTADPAAESLKQQMLDWFKKIPEHTTCRRVTAVWQPRVYFAGNTAVRDHVPGSAGPRLPSTAHCSCRPQGRGGGGGRPRGTALQTQELPGRATAEGVCRDGFGSRRSGSAALSPPA